MKGRTLIRIVFLLYIAAVFYLCFGNFSSLSGAPRHIWGLDSDKVVHFLMFFPFPILTWLALGRRPSGPWPALGLTLLLFLIGCALAACTEIVQQFLPWRSADPRDFSADALALALSALIVFIKMLVTGIRSARTGR